MKVLSVLLLCAFVAVQGRSAGVQSVKSLAALGDNPYLVHLRIAVSTSGLLNSGVGSLIGPNWVLTASSAVENSRFIWIRYGVVNVINPSLVTETNTVRTNPSGLALVSINRPVETNDKIAPITLNAAVSAPITASFCAFGASDDGPGEVLSCFSVDLVQEEEYITATSDEGAATRFDLGAPLVSDGVQVGVLVGAGDDSSAGTFLGTSSYVDWIESETGLVFNPEAVNPEPEPEDDDTLRVNFVN